MRTLEERLEIRLLTRTTRSVSPTDAGERLLNTIGHRFDEIERELEALTALRAKPAGTVRITCGDLVWEFERRGRPLNVHVEGQLTFNTTS